MKARLIAISIIVIVIASTGPVMAIDDWPMFHHDLSLTGYSTSMAPITNEILWIYDTQSAPIESSPAIKDGKLYIGSNNGNLYALDAFDGSLLWMYSTGGAIYSSPAVSGGNVYFLSSNGYIYALNANSGALIWSKDIGPGSWDWSSPALHSGKVFIGASSGFVYCLDSSTGATIWITNIGGSPNSPITVANGKVYSGTHNFSTNAPTLAALDELTGGVIWTYDYHLYHTGVVGMINCNGVAVVDGDDDGDLEVYGGIYNWGGVSNQAVCLDEATGTEVWTSNINGNSSSTPAVHNGMVFIGSDDYNVYCLNAGTGAQVWSFATGGQVWSAPAVADEKVFVGSLDHTIYALDEGTGALIWSYFTGASRLLGSPAIAYGNLYVGNENGKIYAFGKPWVCIPIDIKPGSCPNPFNSKAKGVVPVAIVGSEHYDLSEFNLLTVKLTVGPEGSEQDISPLLDITEIVDSTEPYAENDPTCYNCFDADANPNYDSDDDDILDTYIGDGYMDLVLKFDTQELAAAIAAAGGADKDECVPMFLTGETFSGIPIGGYDSMVMLKAINGD